MAPKWSSNSKTGRTVVRGEDQQEGRSTLQIGLQPGNWTVPPARQGRRRHGDEDVRISIGATEQADLTLAAAGAGGAVSKEDAAFQKAFSEGVAASGPATMTPPSRSRASPEDASVVLLVPMQPRVVQHPEEGPREGRRGVHRGDKLKADAAEPMHGSRTCGTRRTSRRPPRWPAKPPSAPRRRPAGRR